jgi:hypothetical protein
MRGADPVNDEFEVGYNARFEGRWYLAELVGRVVMAAFVGVALSGLLGRGPFSHATNVSADGGLAVDFEPVARFATPTQITLHVRNENDTPREVAVFLQSRIVEPMGYSRSVPRPIGALVSHDGMTLRYAVAPHQTDARIRIEAQPSGIGPVHLSADAGPGARVGWTQVVVP